MSSSPEAHRSTGAYYPPSVRLPPIRTLSLPQTPANDMPPPDNWSRSSISTPLVARPTSAVGSDTVAASPLSPYTHRPYPQQQYHYSPNPASPQYAVGQKRPHPSSARQPPLPTPPPREPYYHDRPVVPYPPAPTQYYHSAPPQYPVQPPPSAQYPAPYAPPPSDPYARSSSYTYPSQPQSHPQPQPPYSSDYHPSYWQPPPPPQPQYQHYPPPPPVPYQQPPQPPVHHPPPPPPPVVPQQQQWHAPPQPPTQRAPAPSTTAPPDKPIAQIREHCERILDFAKYYGTVSVYVHHIQTSINLASQADKQRAHHSPNHRPTVHEMHEMASRAEAIVAILFQLAEEALPFRKPPPEPAPPDPKRRKLATADTLTDRTNGLDVKNEDPKEFGMSREAKLKFFGDNKEAMEQAEKDMRTITMKRTLSQGGVLPSSKTKYKKRSRATPPGKCHSCFSTETPEWRRGPDGARTLCNACGLHYAKMIKRQGGPTGVTIPMLQASAQKNGVGALGAAVRAGTSNSTQTVPATQPTGEPGSASCKPHEHAEPAKEVQRDSEHPGDKEAADEGSEDEDDQGDEEDDEDGEDDEREHEDHQQIAAPYPQNGSSSVGHVQPSPRPYAHPPAGYQYEPSSPRTSHYTQQPPQQPWGPTSHPMPYRVYSGGHTYAAAHGPAPGPSDEGVEESWSRGAGIRRESSHVRAS
ncbi:hypothetical protein FRB99_007995 [Tulasnella sp. 403]|nr:hypothetical protein FRB99_007995 [Tulasnella sp. 403]